MAALLNVVLVVSQSLGAKSWHTVNDKVLNCPGGTPAGTGYQGDMGEMSSQSCETLTRAGGAGHGEGWPRPLNFAVFRGDSTKHCYVCNLVGTPSAPGNAGDWQKLWDETAHDGAVSFYATAIPAPSNAHSGALGFGWLAIILGGSLAFVFAICFVLGGVAVNKYVLHKADDVWGHLRVVTVFALLVWDGALWSLTCGKKQLTRTRQCGAVSDEHAYDAYEADQEGGTGGEGEEGSSSSYQHFNPCDDVDDDDL